MWKPEHRRVAERLRYPNDLTDAEWALVKGMIPPAKRGDGRRWVNDCEVLNSLLRALDRESSQDLIDVGGSSEGPCPMEAHMIRRTDRPLQRVRASHKRDGTAILDEIIRFERQMTSL